MQNRYGLRRDINAPTKRAVRQRCGFGCVVCGCAVVQYHHFNPPFADAARHDPAGITLLCGQCHDRAERGILDPQDVVTADSSPRCRQAGYTGDFLFLADSQIPVHFGSSRVRAASVLMYDDRVVFGFSEPEQPGSPLQLNASLTDEAGAEVLRVVDNEWRAGVDRYDVVVKADTLTINAKRGEIILEMSLAARREIQIRRLRMSYLGFSIVAEEDSFTFRVPGGGTFRHTGNVTADIGIWMKSSGGALVGASQTGAAALAFGPV